MKKAVFSFFILMLLVIPAIAQQQITGKVTHAESGEPLPGVSIVVKNQTTIGTSSGTDGTYTLEDVPSDAETLIFSFVGMKTQEVMINGRSQINVALEPSMTELQEVVAIGYGTQKKGELTGSISSVSDEEFVEGAVVDAADMIRGKVAGLSITMPSGNPTEEAQIMMRGISSLLGNASPLVLVDGVPGSLGTIPPEDIESIDVLKGGSATAIYGTRGTNGVVIITTKKGSEGKDPTIEYTGYTSASSIKKKMDFLSASDLREKWDEGYSFTGANLEDFNNNTDWLDEITRTGISHVHNLTFRGGDKATNLTASVNYRSMQGTFIRSDNEKYTGRIDVNHSMFEGKLKANLGVIASEQKYWTGGDGYSFDNYVYRQAIIRNPTEPVKNDQGNWYERDIYFYDNPVGLLEESEGQNKYRNLRFKGSITYSPMDNLDIEAMYTRKGNSNIRGYYETKNHVSNTKYGMDGYASRGTDDYVGNYSDITANYSNTFGNHNLKILAGYNYEDNTYQGYWANNRYFPSDAYTYNNLGIGNGLTEGEADMGSSKSSNKLVAFFSRVTYNYDQKYLLMASVRREGSSRFGEDYKWGYFPGVSLGWRINEEAFMEGVSWVNNLKLRAGFGITGINVGSSYQSLSSLNYQDYFFYNGEWIRELVPARNPNPDLRWEKKEEFNVGADFNLFENRIGGSIDYYSRTTKDALWNYDVPVPPYLYGSIMANVGEIQNRGIEAKLNVMPVSTDELEWNATMTYSSNQNKLVSLSNDQFQTTNDYFYSGYTGEPIQTTTHIVEIGEPIGNFYGLKSVDITEDGVFIIETPEGDRIPATESSTEDRQVLGNGLPKHYVSWNNSFRYKNFDLSINMRGAFGFQILNFQRMFYENPTINYNTLNSAYDKVYGKAVLNDVQRYVSHYVEDGDYWKIDNVTLGYTFNLPGNSPVKKFRLYLSGRNMFTITGYKGIDPEVNRSGLAPGNAERDQYPTTKTYTFGLNLTF